MSIVENFRTEQAKMLQNHNGQYFFVCSKCHFEFVTLQSFVTHQKNVHNESPIVLEDSVPESNPQPNQQNKFLKPKRSIVGSPTRKVQRTQGAQGGKLRISTPTKPRSTPFVRLQAQRQALDLSKEQDDRKYKCKNCSLTFRTLLYVNLHEENCEVVPLEDRHYEYSCDICSQGFREESDLMSHRRAVHAFF